MNLPYTMRLLCLCLETIFFVNLAASGVVLGLSRQAAHAAAKMRAQRAAGFFLSLRLLPFALSLGVVGMLCIPSYLRFEDNSGSERVGFFCLVSAGLGLALCLTSLYRGVRAFAQLYLFSQSSRVLPVVTTASESDVCLTEEETSGTPLMALVGIVRPRLIVSRRLMETLSPEQFQAALSHERGHQISQDNLKRLLITLTPGMLPFVAGLGPIERQWERYVELAADDYASCGRVDRSVALAEALIKVARLGNFERRIPMASSLSASNVELALRIDRLMAVNSAISLDVRGRRFSWKSALMLTGFAIFLGLLPRIISAVYPLLESLLH